MWDATWLFLLLPVCPSLFLHVNSFSLPCLQEDHSYPSCGSTSNLSVSQASVDPLVKFLLQKNCSQYWSFCTPASHDLALNIILLIALFFFLLIAPQLVIYFLKIGSFFNMLYIYIEQRSPTFLAPGTRFMEDNFSMDGSWVGGMVSGWFKRITFIVHFISIIITL